MALTTQQWVGLLKLLRGEEPRVCGRGHPAEYPWWVMTGLALWAAYYQWSNHQLAGYLLTERWPKAFRRLLPGKLRRRKPDESTLSRRFRSPKLEQMLERALMRLAEPTPFGALDGLILRVGHHSTDGEARFGGRGSHFQKGYKAVRFVNDHGQAWSVNLGSADQPEIALAQAVIDRMAEHGVKLDHAAADSAYDSEEFRQYVAEQLRAFLIAPVFSRGRRPAKGRRRKAPKGSYRRRACQMLRSAWGKHWLKRRGIVERSNGWLRQGPHNLGWLPPFVRTARRVRRWLLSHEVLLSYRKRLRMAGIAA